MARNFMSTQSDLGVNWLACLFEVRDEADEIVLEFPFTMRTTVRSSAGLPRPVYHHVYHQE